jgi:glyoxylase-like metal-dependent hydrolase (beta-lactamase superfamily II)
MSALPPPTENQPYYTISVLEAGHLYCHTSLLIDNAAADETSHLPCLAFLLQHSTKKDKFLFDLGNRKDWDKFPPKLLEFVSLELNMTIKVPQDIIESLAKGGLTPQDIDTVCLSHLHFDHIGDTSAFSKSKFVVGPQTQKLFEDGFYPENPESVFTADILPNERTTYLKDVLWESIGPFPKAYDFYGDGSLYIIDAPGHIWGHINLLARTSADGAWIYLTGDTAHHWNLVTGKSSFACHHSGKATMHLHKELAQEMVKRVGEVMKIPRVKVILSHDKPWYDEHEGKEAFFPTNIESL